MSFRLYDTASRAVHDFEPVVPGEVSIYHCGLTVQAPPHLGHIRKEVVFDVLRRWLTWSGHRVTVAAVHRNIVTTFQPHRLSRQRTTQLGRRRPLRKSAFRGLG